MELGAVEGRVLACLIEKETTVPDGYPLTMNALRTACNQRNNRSPITDFNDIEIDAALQSLKTSGLVRFVHPSHGGRTIRYRHVADEVLDLGVGELGVLAMLILRGPETAATLRARADKHLAAGDVSVEDALSALADHESGPLVRQLPVGVGEREPRFQQAIVDASSASTARDDSTTIAETPAPARSNGSVANEVSGVSELAAMVELLTDEVAELRVRLDRLEAER